MDWKDTDRETGREAARRQRALRPPGRARRGLGLLSPTPRLVVYVGLGVAAAVGFTWPWVLGSLAVGVALLVAGWRFPRLLLVGCAATAAITFATNALFAPDPALARFWVFRISRTSLERGGLLGLRIAAMMLVSIAYIAVTTKPEILAGFRGLRVPRRVWFYLMVVLRYIDIFEYEFDVAVRAVRVRGLRLDRGSWVRRARAYGSLAMPLMARLINRVHTQALAVDSRGILGRGGAVAPRGEAAVVAEGLRVFYGYEPQPGDGLALDGVGFRVGWGEVGFVAGPTDAGKTTLLLACSGLIPHTVGRMDGRVTVAGHDTRRTPMAQLAQLARIVFANPVHGLVGLTVRDELDQGTGPAGAGMKIDVRAALAMVGLDDSFLDRSTLHLSGGEMQRVQLASALAVRPSVLLLDEPTVQLDPQGKDEVLEALHRLGGDPGSPLTVLVADPNFEALHDRVTQVIALQGGRVADSPPPGDPGGAWMRAAHLRIPQMARLGRAIGTALPEEPEAAATVLAPRVNGHPRAAPPAQEPVRGRPLVEARGVSFRYPGGALALDGVDVSVAPGELVFLLGANGSGKTTLSLLLADALDPTAGLVRRDGDARVGYVFQEPELQMVSTTVRDELAFGPRNLGWDEDRVREVTDRELARFGLAPGESPMSTTRARSRKVAIAAVLTMDPAVLILDEPTNGLDEEEARGLFDLLDRLRQGGMGVVVVSHDVELACEYGSRFVVMHGGRVLYDGDPRRIMGDARLLATAGLKPTPVVSLSRLLWPDHPPALTVGELATWLQATIEVVP